MRLIGLEGSINRPFIFFQKNPVQWLHEQQRRVQDLSRTDVNADGAVSYLATAVHNSQLFH